MIDATVFDIETDGFLDVMTKVHVLSYETPTGELKSLTDYDDMRQFFSDEPVICGHNIKRFDLPAVEKILGIKYDGFVVDTLALSWYVNFERGSHGLATYGEDYGIPKPVVEDWENLSVEDYIHRCEEDVKINSRLWKDLKYYLGRLYKTPEEFRRIVDYLSFKLECAAEQEALQWKLNVSKARENLAMLEGIRDEARQALIDVMPKRELSRIITRPKRMRNQDGSLSKYGQNWEELRKEYRQPEGVTQFRIKTGEESANPGSHTQVKDWLFSLGWKPRTFDYKRDKATREVKKIPQVSNNGELCDCVKELTEVEPGISHLEGLSVVNHRISILKGFLENERDGYLRASVHGLTNTLRFKHVAPLVNLPGVDKAYGEAIRELLTAPEGHVVCGSDMVSLEDTTKRHFMYPHDPEYVEDMSREGFDSHLDLALFNGEVTQEDIDRHTSGEMSLGPLRKRYKVVNYSATYGVQKFTLSIQSGMTEDEAQNLLDAFWERNWSLKAIADETRTKTVEGKTWLFNPVSKFWYSLRSDKDKFSTLNQGTGVYCFDRWVCYVRRKGIRICGQFHDEIAFPVRKGAEVETETKLKEAIAEVNNELRLNIDLGVDVKFGDTYADVH